MVYALTAVLESEFCVLERDINFASIHKNENNNNNNNVNEMNNVNDISDKKEDKNEASWKQNFWIAYDAISTDIQNQHLLKIAIELARDKQKAIVDMGTRLIETRSVQSLGPIRYCTIDQKKKFISISIIAIKIGVVYCRCISIAL